MNIGLKERGSVTKYRARVILTIAKALQKGKIIIRERQFGFLRLNDTSSGCTFISLSLLCGTIVQHYADKDFPIRIIKCVPPIRTT